MRGVTLLPGISFSLFPSQKGTKSSQDLCDKLEFVVAGVSRDLGDVHVCTRPNSRKMSDEGWR